MSAVYKHEMTMYSHSMKACLFAAFLLVFTGIGSLIYNINASVANFEYVLGFISIIFVILVPLLTMRVMAEERKQKTDQLLFSLPISTTDIVLGKYFAMATVFAVPMVLICFYPLIFSRFGDVYLPASYGAIVAFLFLGLALLSIGMFISCLTESQGTAAGIGVAAMLFCYYSDTLANYVSSSATGSVIAMVVLIILIALLVKFLTKSDFAAIIVGAVLAIAVIVTCMIDSSMLENLLPTVMQKLSLYSRFETFVNGVFDLTALIYDASVTAFFLFLCVQALEKRRYNG